MADLPILTNTKDLNKIPQSSENPINKIVAYTNLAAYFFTDDLIYKIDDVFIVTNDLSLTTIAIAKDATDDHIPRDTKYEGMVVTTTSNPTTPVTTPSVSAGRAQRGDKNIANASAQNNVNGITAYPGGITWISYAIAFWGDHPRAYDRNGNYPLIAGVQGFAGGNGSNTGFTNIYYLGCSAAGYPLYSASMCFRMLGYRINGIGIALDYTHGFLQIGAGTINDWYGESIRVPQNSKASFYYAHDNIILNSPALTVTEDDLKKRYNNGTLVPLVANEVFWHFVYLDPLTLSIYIVLWSHPTAIINSGSSANPLDPGVLINAINYHSATRIPDFLRENGVLLGCIAGGNNRIFTAAGTPVFMLHNFIAGTGSAIHPGVPSPEDYPYGGTLKAKGNIYEIDFNYDGYLISEAVALKNNYLFIYNENFPRKLAISEYQTTKFSVVKMLNMGGPIKTIDAFSPSTLTLQYSWYDLAQYQDPNEGGLYYGSYLTHNPNVDYPEYIQIAEIKRTSAIVKLNTSAGHYMPIFVNTFQMNRQTAGNTYSTLMGCPKIPGINGGTAAENGIFRYTQALRAKRGTHSSADSVVMIEGYAPSRIYSDLQMQQYLMKYMNDDALRLINQLVSLIGPSLVAQIKEKFEIVKEAGFSGIGGRTPMPIVGYYIDNISTSDSMEYCLPGVMGLVVDSSTGNIVLDTNYPIYIQPADVFGLTTGDLTPLQAVMHFMQLRFKYLSYIFNGLEMIQMTEMPIS